MIANKSVEYYMSLPYSIIVRPDRQQGGWYIKVAELEGCMTQADRWEDVLPMAEEAMRLWLEATLEDGDPVPEPDDAINGRTGLS
jgi:predicted RNase H-like HicB family nuclease